MVYLVFSELDVFIIDTLVFPSFRSKFYFRRPHRHHAFRGGPKIKLPPSPRGADAPASTGLIERLTSVAGDFSNESSDEKTVNDFAAALRRNTFRRQLLARHDVIAYEGSLDDGQRN